MTDNELNPGESPNVFADPYSDEPRPIGRDVIIRFGDVENGAWLVELKDGELNIRFHSLNRVSIGVLPQSANAVALRSIEL